MAITINQVIEMIPGWDGRKVVYQPMAGGITNNNYRVEVEDQLFFLRIPGSHTDLLGIDRINEHRNTVLASETGVSPKVILYLEEYNVMVMEFLEGETMSSDNIARFKEPGMAARVALSLKLLHAGPAFKNDFNIFRLMDHYIDVVTNKQIQLPDGFIEILPIVTEIEDGLKINQMRPVACHNDLIPENFIDDGKLLRLIDFEYSGNNDPCFELGMTAQSLEYDESTTLEFCNAYFGETRLSMLARVQLYALTAHLVWTVWSYIQNEISTIDYDFLWNADYHWIPAQRILKSEKYTEWLDYALRKD